MKRPSNVTSTAAILGQILAILRDQENLTQAKVAEMMGICTASWSRVENGKADLGVGQLRAIAEILGTTPILILEAVVGVEHHVQASGLKLVAGHGSSGDILDRFRDQTGIYTGMVLPVFGTALCQVVFPAVIRSTVYLQGDRRRAAA
jgi:transcriptional regulator with XRE-family HTH domain